jgi:hypothetical protein
MPKVEQNRAGVTRWVRLTDTLQVRGRSCEAREVHRQQNHPMNEIGQASGAAYTSWRHYFDPLEHREMACACILLLQRHTNNAPVKIDLKSPLQPMCQAGQIVESTLSIQLINYERLGG